MCQRENRWDVPIRKMTLFHKWLAVRRSWHISRLSEKGLEKALRTEERGTLINFLNLLNGLKYLFSQTTSIVCVKRLTEEEAH